MGDYEKAVLVRFRGERELKTLEDVLKIFKKGQEGYYSYFDSNNQIIIRALKYAVEQHKLEQKKLAGK